MNTGRRYSLLLLPGAALLYLLFATYKIATPDLGQDEARYAITALNMMADTREFPVVSAEPFGRPDGHILWAYSTLLALSMSVFGRGEFGLRIVNVILLGGAGFLVYRLALRLLKDRALACVAGAFFLLNPTAISYARPAMVEPSVAFWGCVAMILAAAYCDSPKTWRALLCGIALALGFLSKLWLIMPYGLPCLALMLLAPRQRTRLAADVALCGAAFLALTGSHLLLVSWIAPEHYRDWVYWYFVGTLASRVSGPGYDPAQWYRPWWFYAGVLFKCLFPVLPLVLLGLRPAFRERGRVVALWLAALFAPAIAISFLKVKLAAYAYFLYPGLAVVVACGYQHFRYKATSREIAIAGAASAAIALCFIGADVVSGPQLAAILLLYALYAAAAQGGALRVWTQRALVGAVAVTILVSLALVVRRSLRDRIYYRELAPYFQSLLHERPVGPSTFVAPHYAAITFRTFRHGENWGSYYFHKTGEEFRRELDNRSHAFYIVDDSGKLYGGKPEPERLELLRRRARDVTGELEVRFGVKLPYRVFVPAPNSGAARFTESK